MAYLKNLFRHSNNPFLEATVDGNMYGASFGSVTTPLASPATTAITARRPQAWLRVLDGRVVIPRSLEIVIEAAGATTQGEIAIAMTTNDLGNGTSAAGTIGPLNLRSDSTKTSTSVPRQLATADVTLETGYLELERFTFAASGVNQTFKISADILPMIVGPSTLAVYIGGNAVNFFSDWEWLEVPEEFAS